MQTKIRKLVRRAFLLTCGAGLFQAQGCVLDPDIILRTQISAATDFAIFMLDNLTAGF